MAESRLASEAMLTVDQRAAIGTVAVETTAKLKCADPVGVVAGQGRAQTL